MDQQNTPSTPSTPRTDELMLSSLLKQEFHRGRQALLREVRLTFWGSMAMAAAVFLATQDFHFSSIHGHLFSSFMVGMLVFLWVILRRGNFCPGWGSLLESSIRYRTLNHDCLHRILTMKFVNQEAANAFYESVKKYGFATVFDAEMLLRAERIALANLK